MEKYITNYKSFKTTIVFLVLFVSTVAYAQPPIQWQKCLGGSLLEGAYSTVPTTDGGYITIGDSRSNDLDVSGQHGVSPTLDIWVVKTDVLGNIQWQKCFGGSHYEASPSIIQTADGGYIFAGTVSSNAGDGDAIGQHGIVTSTPDVWVVKLDLNGNIQWQKCLGGTSSENGRVIKQTSDGGYIVGAITVSNDGDVSGNHGGTDLWIVKLDPTGNIQWQKCLGGSSNEGGYYGITTTGYNVSWMGLVQTADGGYFVTTASCSGDGDLTSHYGGNNITTDQDYWLVKLNSSGVIQWQKNYGGTGTDRPMSGFQTSDGGYIVTGSSGSIDGEVTGNHGGLADMWVVKTDSLGSIVWKKCYGGSSNESGTFMSPTNDGGYIVCGYAQVNSGDVAGIHGVARDFWLVKLDATGILQWQKCLGGTGTEIAGAVFQTSDGGYFLTGSTASADGDVIEKKGGRSFWLLKLYATPNHVINGTIYEDLNGNCLKDANEPGLAGKMVKAMPGNYYASTDVNGNYSLFVNSGSYAVSHMPPTYYDQSCPGSSGDYNVTVNSLTPSSYGNDFADTINVTCIDLKVNIGTNILRRCFKNNYVISYKNMGVIAVSGVTVAVNFDPEVIPLSSTIPWTIVGNQYIFNLGTLQAGQTGSFYVTDSVSCFAVLGSVKCASAVISSSFSDCDTLNNHSSDCRTVIASYDPNSLEVESQVQNNGYVMQENISATDKLTYLIQFQNTGTDTAFTVVVRDTLSHYLEGSSLELEGASHPYTFRIYEQGICEWTFNHIHLPDSTTNEVASHGFIKFGVKQISGNQPGTTIRNGSAIWFDYNVPVITNETFNHIPLVTGIKEMKSISSDILVFPNPFDASTVFYVKNDLKNADLIVYDVVGREVNRLSNISGKQITFNRNNLTSGLYFYSIIQDNAIIYTGKIVAE